MELVSELRRGAVVRAAASVLVAGLGVLVTLVATFNMSVESALDQGVRVDGSQRVLSLTDTLDQSGDFARYFDGPDGGAKAMRFYNALGSLRSAKFATMMDQPVLAEGFPGMDALRSRSADGAIVGAQPDPVFGGRPAYALTSIQMNEATWRRFGLRVDRGTAIPWPRVDYGAGVLPVVVGSGYVRAKGLGDVIPVDYYGRHVDLKIVGILPPRSVVFQEGDEDHVLDDSIIVPYAGTMPVGAASGTLRDFYRELGSNLTHGDLLYAQPTTSKQVERAVADAASVSGFDAYAFARASNVLVHYRLMRTILETQRAILFPLAAGVGLVVSLLAAAARRWAARRRAPWVGAQWAVGTARRRIHGVVVFGHAAYSCLALAILVAAIGFIPRGGPGSFAWGLGVVVVLIGLDVADALRLTDQSIESRGQEMAG